MKKLRVVCQAGPRSRSVPRPRPSRFQRNSFRPLETRVVWSAWGGRFAPADATGEPEPRCCPAPPGGVWGATVRLARPPGPIPNLFRSPIELDHRRSGCGVRVTGFRLLCLRGCVAELRFCRATARLAGFDFAAENGTVFNGQAFGTNFAGHAPGIPQLHTLGAVNFSVHVATNNNFASRNVRFDFPVWTNGAGGIAEVEFALDSAIDKQ